MRAVAIGDNIELELVLDEPANSDVASDSSCRTTGSGWMARCATGSSNAA